MYQLFPMRQQQDATATLNICKCYRLTKPCCHLHEIRAGVNVVNNIKTFPLVIS